MEKQNVKKFDELDNKQQKLFTELASVIEKNAKESELNTRQGLYQIFETLVTLTLAMKSFYLLKSPKQEGTK